MKIYIAGQVTGIENDNRDEFNDAEYLLKMRHKGCEIINPISNVVDTTGLSDRQIWVEYMKISVRQITECEVLATLEGWEKSSGAKIEVELAKRLGLLVTSVQALTL